MAGGDKDGSEKKWPQVRQERQQEGGERHAPKEAWHASFRQRRQGRYGKKPQAGHRHRPLGSPQGGREGPEKTIQLKVASGTRTREAVGFGWGQPRLLQLYLLGVQAFWDGPSRRVTLQWSG